MLHPVDWYVVTNIFKDHSAFIFSGKQSKKYWKLNNENEGIMIL